MTNHFVGEEERSGEREDTVALAECLSLQCTVYREEERRRGKGEGGGRGRNQFYVSLFHGSEKCFLVFLAERKGGW